MHMWQHGITGKMKIMDCQQVAKVAGVCEIFQALVLSQWFRTRVIQISNRTVYVPCGIKIQTLGPPELPKEWH